MGELDAVMADIKEPLIRAITEGNTQMQALTEEIDKLAEKRRGLRSEITPLVQTLRKIDPEHELVQVAPSQGGSSNGHSRGRPIPVPLPKNRLAVASYILEHPEDEYAKPLLLETPLGSQMSDATLMDGLKFLRSRGALRLTGEKNISGQGGRAAHHFRLQDAEELRAIIKEAEEELSNA